MNAAFFNTAYPRRNEMHESAGRRSLLEGNRDCVARMGVDGISCVNGFENQNVTFRRGLSLNIADREKTESIVLLQGEKDSLFADMPFSVAMSVYGKDNAEWFDTALESVIVKQTVKPAEVVLVVDGPVPDSIQQVINKYRAICNINGDYLQTVYLPENKGLGNALKVAVDNCKCGMVARMDSDDIAVSNRFELQLRRMRRNDCDICGGQIEEFIGQASNIVGKRVVPETDGKLKEYMKKRCPFNHMTVMFKRQAVLNAGSYRDWFWNEDYYLWIRMALADMKFANVPETLVHVRVGEDMYARRGGKKYFLSELGLQKLMLREKMIGIPTYFTNCVKRVIIQVLLPNCVRGWIFRKFARK